MRFIAFLAAPAAATGIAVALPPHRTMTARSLALFGLFVSLSTMAWGQWKKTTYALRGGWNAIYLHGDATHATPDDLFDAGDALNIEEIWRWNPSPTQVQFTTTTLLPATGSPEWSVWKRGLPGESALSAMIGQTAYLVKCTGDAADSYAVQIKHRPLPPASIWVRNGANLLGFPTSPLNGFPTFSAYFATFPAAVAANTRIFRYTGGDLGPANPVQVFATASERVDRNQAYWFDAEVVGNFYASIEIAPSVIDGLVFGRTRSVIAIRLRNRTAAPVTIMATPENSALAPAGQAGISGVVPLTRREWNASLGAHEETAIDAAFNVVIGPQDSVELEFGIDRTAMTGESDAFYASFLKFTDSGNLIDVSIPANAQIASLAGLWIGEALVESVESLAPGSPGEITRRPFSMRYIVHVADDGTARLLSEVYMGPLAEEPHHFGNATLEAGLRLTSLASARRISADHIPAGRVLLPDSGSVALNSTVTWTIQVPFSDPLSPFVHTYDPEHDNLDAPFNSAPAGRESGDVTREVRFEFLPTPIPGESGLGWGTTVLGGHYHEILSCGHQEDIFSAGSFILRRINEIGSIDLGP